MSDITDYRATLMGDIVFYTGGEVTISMTVSGPATYEHSEVITPGTWFASPLHFWQWLVSQWNANTVGDEMSVELVADPEDTNYGKFKVTPETGLGTITALSVTIPEVYAACGLASATVDLGAGNTVKYTGVAPYVLTFFWPVAVYNRRVDVLSGYTDYAEDGTVYSTEGEHQEMHELSFALDRYNGYDEVSRWLALWTYFWARGRSVAFYLDNLALPTVWATTLGDGLSLVSEPVNDLSFDRLVEQTNSIDYSALASFYERVGGRVARSVP